VVNAQPPGNATISGTVRCGSSCSSVGLSNGDPVQSAGKVIAHMTMALDPYTGAQRPDLPTTDGQTTFDASAHGQYMIQGLNPGIYDLYASADGYQLTLVVSQITVQAGQNLHYDAYLNPIGATPEFPSATTLLIVVMLAFVAISLATKRRTKKLSTSAS